MLDYIKNVAAGLVFLIAIMGLIWFVATHWVICLIIIFCYAVYEICRNESEEL